MRAPTKATKIINVDYLLTVFLGIIIAVERTHSAAAPPFASYRASSSNNTSPFCFRSASLSPLNRHRDGTNIFKNNSNGKSFERECT